MKPFLTAKWLNLINLTWEVEQEKLMPYLPKGVSLDVMNGKALVSVVAFEFHDTRFQGFKFPFHVNFPEVNLRFYVNDGKNPGVVFLKEFVTKPVISFIANTFFHEHYEVVGLDSEKKESAGHISMEYHITKAGKKNSIHAIAEDHSFFPEKDSLEYFLETRFAGFASSRSGHPMMFHVEHPAWEIYKLKDYWIHFDFGLLYGKEWAFLNNEKPVNAMLIKGSEVGMFPHVVMLNEVKHLSKHVLDSSLRSE